jgi:hypothetical protein
MYRLPYLHAAVKRIITCVSSWYNIQSILVHIDILSRERPTQKQKIIFDAVSVNITEPLKVSQFLRSDTAKASLSKVNSSNGVPSNYAEVF